MAMKNNKIIYWTTTVLAVLLGSLSAATYFTVPSVIEGFHKLGFPDYFRIELAIAKLIGGVLLLLPVTPRIVREWVYAGFGIVFVSAFIAHASVEGLSSALFPLLPLTLLSISYMYFLRLNGQHTTHSTPANVLRHNS